VTAGTPVRIGTRGSQLAIWQARRVADLLESRLRLASELVVIKTGGDRVLDLAFHKMEGKGFFTKELQEALLSRDVDIVVHSLKDLPTEGPEDLAVAAIPERANPADLLLARRDLLQPTVADPLGLPAGSVLGTSSLRRAAQALAASPKLSIRALRGNVPTRIRKLREGLYDAILVAAAGVERLDLDVGDLDRIELPPELMLPAPAQGALAIESRADSPLLESLGAIHDPSVARCVACERSLLQLLGGGCHLPLGCLAEPEGDSLRLQAALGEIDDEITRAEISRVAAVASEPEDAARGCHEALRLALPKVVAS
jgi:hydroxymethylbilane synthase